MIVNAINLNELLRDWHPALREAFIASIASLKSAIVLNLVISRLEAGDIQGAIDSMRIEREAFAPFEMAISDAFNAGGIAQSRSMRTYTPEGNRLSIRFGVRNPRAEAWLSQHSGTMITRIIDNQLEAIRVTLTEGMEAGQNPRAVALGVIGRVSRTTGRREGGIIGLTSQQAEFVRSARRELLSGDPADLRNYLARERRDHRFDTDVQRALETGKPIPADRADWMVARYSDRLLALRGETIARTEAMTALNGGRMEAMRQAIEKGEVDPRFVTKRWRASHDRRTRNTHRILDKQEVAFEHPFVSYTGALIQYPGDPNAPAREHINCRCTMELEIDYIGQLAAQRQAA